jgi:alkylation response protein AidB-like acyl-CoA dehydrogenase
VELDLSDEQAFFVETTRRFLEAECGIPAVRDLADDPVGYDAHVWAQGAQLGWTSLLVPEADGGGSFSDHGLADLVLVAEEMGRRVSPGPLVPVNLVASALSAQGTDDQVAQVLPGLLDGSAVATWTGPGTVPAAATADGYSRSGSVAAVEAAAEADHLLVVAEVDGGLTHLLVPADAPGVTVTQLGSLDLVRRYGSVTFDAVTLGAGSVVGEPGGAADEVERLLQVATVLVCAEAAGATERCFEMTVEYLGDRYSFGRPLSSYQALKHRLADDKMWLEGCHAIVSGAAAAVAAGADDARELASAAKAWVGPNATEIIQDCIQLHGGIGITWEHDLHLYLRRATVDRLAYGAPDVHADRVAGLLLAAAS